MAETVPRIFGKIRHYFERGPKSSFYEGFGRKNGGNPKIPPFGAAFSSSDAGKFGPADPRSDRLGRHPA